MNVRECTSVRPQLVDWRRVAVVAVGSNLVFLLMMVLTAQIPADHLRERVVTAFETGSLSLSDRLSYDRRIGWHQYNDCLILQMISNEDSALHRAVGPITHYRDEFRNFCRTVAELVSGDVSPDQLDTFRYTRYWHGHNALAASMLYLWELSTVRTLLKAAAYLSLIGLAVVAVRGPPELRILGLCMAVFGLLFWGLPYYAQSPSHGPGDTTVVLGFVTLLAVARNGVSVGWYMGCCAAFASALVYMEFLTGLLPTAAAFLLPFGYFAAGRFVAGADGACDRWRFALAGMVAFAIGVAVTVIFKQALAVSVFGWSVVDAFTNNLNYYVQNPDAESSGRLWLSVQVLVYMIRRWAAILAYGSSTGGNLLFLGSAVAWIAALVLALRARRAVCWHALAACAGGALLVFLWIVLLPTHSMHHPYMVRMMIAPLALGWAALFIQFGLAGLLPAPWFATSGKEGTG